MLGSRASPLQHRHQRVRLVDAGREHAARAVIFERAAEQRHAIGKQCRGKRVARMAGEFLAVEAETDRCASGRSSPPLAGAARAHALRLRPCGARVGLPVSASRAKPALEILWVTVLRVTAQMRAAAARMLPDFVVVAGRVQPVVDIGVPRLLIGRGRIGTRAVAVALVGEFGEVARAAIGAGDDHFV